MKQTIKVSIIMVMLLSHSAICHAGHGDSWGASDLAQMKTILGTYSDLIVTKQVALTSNNPAVALTDVKQYKNLSSDSQSLVNKALIITENIEGFMMGVEFGMKQTTLETEIGKNTNIFDIKETRDAYDWVKTSASVIATAAGTYMALKGKDFGNSGAVTGVGVAISASGLVSLFSDSILSPKSKQSVARIATQTAISRQAYDDTLIKLQSYKEITSNIETVHNSKAKVLKSQIENYVLNNSTMDITDFFKELSAMGEDLSDLGNKLGDIINTIEKQTNYYAQMVNDNNNKDNYLKELLDKYITLHNEAKQQLDDYNKEYGPMFKLINQASFLSMQVVQ